MPTALEQIHQIASRIEADTLFYVFCPEHMKVYYQAKDDNLTTRGVADYQIQDHNGFFNHHATVIPGPRC